MNARHFAFLRARVFRFAAVFRFDFSRDFLTIALALVFVPSRQVLMTFSSPPLLGYSPLEEVFLKPTFLLS